MTAIVIFFLLSLINVVLQTLKSILTVKATPRVASIMTAIAFAFYYVLMKQLTDFSILETVVVTIIANLIGVSFSMWLLEKIKHDQLWKISVTCKNFNDSELIAMSLRTKQIGYTVIEMQSKPYTLFDIYCETQKQTETVKNILKDKNVKYHYIPVKTL